MLRQMRIQGAQKLRRRASALPRGAAVVVLGLVVVLWAGARKTPAPPACGGTALALDVGSSLPVSFRVGTFNIHGGVGVDRRRDLARTAAALRGFEVVGLQEVHGRGQVQELEGALRIPGLFAPTERRWWRDDFGNALLSRGPVQQWWLIPLSGSRSGGYRNMLLARVEAGNRTVNVLTTHLERREGREAQLRAVAGLFLSLAEPAVLLGDLNTNADDPEMKKLLAAPGVVDALGSATPGPHIDWILLRGLRVIDAGSSQDGSSDHPVVWAQVE